MQALKIKNTKKSKGIQVDIKHLNEIAGMKFTNCMQLVRIVSRGGEVFLGCLGCGKHLLSHDEDCNCI